ncbi:MAG: aminoglycoside phosphotransferase family protein [Mycobacteriales bacterium]
MLVPRMHGDEVPITDELVRDLLATQCPEYAGRALVRLDTWGTDHVIYRLGDDLSVRLPKIGWAAYQGEQESRWLPRLARHLPVAVPVPVFHGTPAQGYPYPWYVAPWIAGNNPSLEPRGLDSLARDLADFVRALQAIDADDGPRPTGSQRGGPLAGADASTRARAEELRAGTDVDALLAIWEAGLHAPVWAGPPRWVHGDLMDGNLLIADGRLAAVIDWGGLKAGDPAVELMIAWSFFDATSRGTYRESLGFVDEAMWLRGRAWATSAALQALPYYRDTNPDIVIRSWRTVHAVLADAQALS